MKQNKTVDPPVPRNVMFDAQYQVHSPISTKFFVDVSQTAENGDDLNAIMSPANIKSEIVMNVSSSNIMDETPQSTAEAHDTQVSEEIIDQPESQPLNISQQIENSVDPASSQDITDVLEILLKSGEWTDDHKGNNFIQNINGFANDLSAKNFIDDVLSAQNHFNVMSPMNEDRISPIVEETLDKILGKIYAGLRTQLKK